MADIIFSANIFNKSYPTSCKSRRKTCTSWADGLRKNWANFVVVEPCFFSSAFDLSPIVDVAEFHNFLETKLKRLLNTYNSDLASTIRKLRTRHDVRVPQEIGLFASLFCGELQANDCSVSNSLLSKPSSSISRNPPVIFGEGNCNFTTRSMQSHALPGLFTESVIDSTGRRVVFKPGCLAGWLAGWLIGCPFLLQILGKNARRISNSQYFSIKKDNA